MRVDESRNTTEVLERPQVLKLPRKTPTPVRLGDFRGTSPPPIGRQCVVT